MRVLHIVHWARSGIGAVVDSVISEQKKLGVDSSLMVLKGDAGKYGKDATEVAHGILDGNKVIGLLSAQDIIRERRFDVIHSHSFTPMLIATMFGSGIKKIRTVHTKYPYLTSRHPRSAMKRTIERKLMASQDAATVVAEDLSDETRQALSPRKLVHVANGVRALRSFPKKKRNPMVSEQVADIVVGAVGRLDQEKGFDILVETTKLLEQRVNGFLEVHVAGAGALKDELQALAKKKGVAHKIKFLGHVDDIPEFLSRCDYFVSSSRFEGMALSPLEALSYGIPVVTTPTTGAATLISKNAWGIVTKDFEPKSLADGIIEMIKSDDTQAKTAAAKEAIVRDYTIERMARGYFDLYASLQ